MKVSILQILDSLSLFVGTSLYIKDSSYSILDLSSYTYYWAKINNLIFKILDPWWEIRDPNEQKY